MPYWLALRRLRKRRSAEYRGYLDVQLRRSLSKRDTDPGVGAHVLVGEVAKRCRKRGRVLCVGCRNALELDRFRAVGFDDVVGIDLFSQRADILVMDMHEMTFSNESFDVVYSSHSLEHSHDVRRVVEEIARVSRNSAIVAVEVPIRTASAADRVVFDGVDALLASFQPYVGELFLKEDQPARSATNAQGTDVARVVFSLAADRGR